MWIWTPKHFLPELLKKFGCKKTCINKSSIISLFKPHMSFSWDLDWILHGKTALSLVTFIRVPSQLHWGGECLQYKCGMTEKMCKFKVSVFVCLCFCLVCFSFFRESCITLLTCWVATEIIPVGIMCPSRNAVFQVDDCYWYTAFPTCLAPQTTSRQNPISRYRLAERNACQEVHVHAMRLFLTFVALQCEKTICIHQRHLRRQLISTFCYGPTSTFSFNSKYSAQDL